MNHAKIRAKVLAVEAGYHVHVHGWFGEVTPAFNAPGQPYCQACEKRVGHHEVVSPYAQGIDYVRDVNALLKAFDDAEDQIAQLEDGAER